MENQQNQPISLEVDFNIDRRIYGEKSEVSQNNSWGVGDAQ